MEKVMTAEMLLGLYRELESMEIKIWLDGGWGIDALLGQQTRQHADVDFVVREKDLRTLDSFLRAKGLHDIPRDDTSSWNYVLGDEQTEVDIHVINFNENGDGLYGRPEDGKFYPSYAFNGTGIINGTAVLCLTAQYQLESHSGYTLREKDFQDIRNLCQQFNLPLPKEYQ